MDVEINGKKTALKFDFGAVRLFKQQSGKNFMGLKAQDFQDEDNIAYLLLAVAKRGNSKITMSDIDSLTFGEIMELTEKLNSMMTEFFPEAEPKAEGEQSPLT